MKNKQNFHWNFEPDPHLQQPYIDRRFQKTVLVRSHNLLRCNNKIIAQIIDETEIKNPTFLQKYRNCIVDDGKHIDTTNSNAYVSMDVNGNMTFSKEVKLICYF